jgi:hypothetical protein
MGFKNLIFKEMRMDFKNRLKKEITEGAIRALLVDAGYRVIDIGIERVVRELECMSERDYLSLGLPKSLRTAPDLLVMNKDQTEKFIVEIKYRKNWDIQLFENIRDQLQHVRELLLILILSEPPKSSYSNHSPSSYIRCCKVKCDENGVVSLNLKSNQPNELEWITLENLKKDSNSSFNFWKFVKLQDIFKNLNEDARGNKTIINLINSLDGILNKKNPVDDLA